MKLILLLTIALILNACEYGMNDTGQSHVALDSPYQLEVYQKAVNDWGYRILKEGTPFIEQPHIPSVPGNKGFNSKENAQVTAEFIIYKLNKGIVPPTISFHELDSLKVLND